MHLANKVIHAIEFLLAAFDDELYAFAQNIELSISDQDGNLNQCIIIDIESGHLAIDPDQIRGVVFTIL